MIILRYHEIFFRLTVPRCPSMAAGVVSLRKSHDIVVLSFCNIIKCQANYIYCKVAVVQIYNTKILAVAINSSKNECSNDFAQRYV